MFLQRMGDWRDLFIHTIYGICVSVFEVFPSLEGECIYRKLQLFQKLFHFYDTFNLLIA